MGTTVGELKGLNDLANENLIFVGQSLKVPSGGDSGGHSEGQSDGHRGPPAPDEWDQTAPLHPIHQVVAGITR